MSKFLFAWILPLGLAGSIACLLLLVLTPIVRRMRAVFRKRVLVCVVLLFVLPLPLLFAASPFANTLQNTLPPATPVIQAVQTLHDVSALQNAPTEHTNNTQTEAGENTNLPTRTAIAWPTVLGRLYLVGGLFFLGISLLRYFFFCRSLQKTVLPPGSAQAKAYARLCAKMGIAKPPALLVCTSLHTPVVLGMLRPKILLPHKELDNGTLLALQHELTHYRWGDVYLKALFVLACTLHWFNPAAHWARLRFAHFCEEACDERMVLSMDSCKRKEYAQTLLEYAGKPAPAPASGFSHRAQKLQKRLVRLLQPTAPRLRLRVLCSILMVATLCAGMLAGCSLAAGATSPSSGTSAPSSISLPPSSGTSTPSSVSLPSSSPPSLSVSSSPAAASGIAGTPKLLTFPNGDGPCSRLSLADEQPYAGDMPAGDDECPWDSLLGHETTLTLNGGLDTLTFTHIWSLPFEQYCYMSRGYLAGIHNGLDFNGPHGAAITAAAGGTVEVVEFHHNYGNYMIINHGEDGQGNTLRTLYAHMDELNAALTVGQNVPCGTLLGTNGATGNSNGPHLHFEILVNDEPVDPTQSNYAYHFIDYTYLDN